MNIIKLQTPFTPEDQDLGSRKDARAFTTALLAALMAPLFPRLQNSPFPSFFPPFPPACLQTRRDCHLNCLESFSIPSATISTPSAITLAYVLSTNLWLEPSFSDIQHPPLSILHATFRFICPGRASFQLTSVKHWGFTKINATRSLALEFTVSHNNMRTDKSILFLMHTWYLSIIPEVLNAGRPTPPGTDGHFTNSGWPGETTAPSSARPLPPPSPQEGAEGPLFLRSSHFFFFKKSQKLRFFFVYPC